MQFFFAHALVLGAVSVLAGCGGGGGGGGSLRSDGCSIAGSNVIANNQSANTSIGVYDSQTPVNTNQPVLKPAKYPGDWTCANNVTPPKVDPIVSVYSDGTSVTRDGTTAKPFLQSELSSASVSITDPNAVVRSVTKSTGANSLNGYQGNDYDLRWGTPDTKGPGYAKQYDSGSWQSADPLKFWGQTLTGCSMILTGSSCKSTTTGPSLAKPAQEVVDAWNLGWTGKGVNILMEDLLTGTNKNHGVITSLIAFQFAPNAKMYGFDIDVNAPNKDVVDLKGATIVLPIKIGVVNASFVGENPNGDYSNILARYNNASYLGQANYTDAVITKAAGNDSQASQNEPVNKALISNTQTNSRLLIVGALTQAGTTDTPVDIASYSNKAGTDASVNSRYLLASGTVPFVTGGLVVDGNTVQAKSNVGTSYAAPRVAGMVAIVRSKFPNLNASQTASIMLDTARYDTLNCNKTALGCDKTIYGKGEASLSRALAPVGKLR